MKPSIAIALLVTLTASLANVARTIHRRERSIERRFEGFLRPARPHIKIDLPAGKELNLVYLKKGTPSDAEMTVWLS